MDKHEKLEKAKEALQKGLEKLEEVEKKSGQDVEALLDLEAEQIEGGIENQDEIQHNCGFFCASKTF